MRKGDDQFSLAAGFQAMMVLLSIFADLLDDLLLLVDLYRIDSPVRTLVAGILDCIQKTLIDVLDAVIQDIGEAQQNRKA